MKIKTIIILILVIQIGSKSAFADFPFNGSNANRSAGFAKENLPQGFQEQEIKKISFTENKGQFADQNYHPRPDVLFGGTDGQITFHITNKGISYQLYRLDRYKEVEDPKTNEKRKEIDQQTIYRTDIKWLNANTNPIVKTDEALPGYNNYYLEQCPNGALNVKSYKGITLQNIYSNIDLHYYEKEGQLKYDYILAPHTDYKQIQLKVEGAKLNLQEDGSLLIETPLGKIQEHAPLVYQNGKQLKAKYNIKGNVIGFIVENYNSNYELVIDPVTRLWGTYYGGAGDEYENACSADKVGNVYLAGFTSSNTGTVIATSGSHQSTFGGADDAFLVKFNGTGQRQWSTYYGGAGYESGNSCCTDTSGNVYLAGNTGSNSGTVIATAGVHQTTYGGSSDAFLVKFNSAGQRQWGTYYGGSFGDHGNSCCTDTSGNVYLAGYTSSNSGTAIGTAGSHQSAHGGGTNDAFLVKFNSIGQRQWGTYYGGAQNDHVFSCGTDALGNVYLAGNTLSSTGTIIATAGSHQSTHGGGTYDGFLVKFNGAGQRQWGTYYGGAGDDLANSCSIDASGNIFMAGSSKTSTGTAIATVGSHQSTNGGGGGDSFIVKFNSAGQRQWGTYYGGDGYEYAWSCSTDASGNVYLAGYTETTTGTAIATAGSYQSVFGGGTEDAFLVKFNGAGQRQWGTYYGGAGDDQAWFCSADAFGSVYLAGYTDSNTGAAIATLGSHQPTLGGSFDDFLVKFDDGATTAINENTITVSEAVVFPNPNKGVFTIDASVQARIVVVNALGQEVYSLDTNENGVAEVSIANLESGIYFVKILHEQHQKVIKIVKE